MPATAFGSRAVIEEVEETTWGTTPGSPITNYVEFERESLGENADVQPSANLPRNRKITHVRRSRRKPGGDIESTFGLRGFGTALKHALGAVQTTGTGPYTHTITPAADLPPGRTIHKFFEDISKGFQFKGCRVNRLRMEFPNEGDVRIIQGLIAKEVVTTTALLNAAPNDRSDKQVAEWEATLKIDDTAFAYLESLNFEVLNNAKLLFGIGSEAAVLTGEALRTVTGNLNIFVTDLTEYTKFVNGTAAKLEVTITQGAHSCIITMPECIYHGDPVPKIDSAEERIMNLPFHCKGAAGDDITITLVNDVATI